MLLRENYTVEHISRLREETGADPSILERTVFAFGLLEAIRSVEIIPFVSVEEHKRKGANDIGEPARR